MSLANGTWGHIPILGTVLDAFVRNKAAFAEDNPKSVPEL